MRLLAIILIFLSGCLTPKVHYSTKQFPWSIDALPASVIVNNDTCTESQVLEAINFWNQINTSILLEEEVDFDGPDNISHATILITSGESKYKDLTVTPTALAYERSFRVLNKKKKTIKHFSSVIYFRKPCNSLVLAHEMGHSFGLQHNNREGSIMCEPAHCMGWNISEDEVKLVIFE